MMRLFSRKGFSPSEYGEGQRIYLTLCYGCHESMAVTLFSKGKMRNGGPVDLESIAKTVRQANPAGSMPGFPTAILTDAQLRMVAAYLYRLAPSADFKTTEGF